MHDAEPNANGKSRRWPISLLMFAAMVFLLQFRPIHDVDVFLQIRLGELTLERGWPPEKEPFAAGHENDPLIPLSWLAQVVLAVIHRVGGWGGVHIVDAMVWAGGFIAVARVAAIRASAFGVIGAVTIGFGVALPFASVRPQSFAVLAFGIFLVLSSKEFWRWRTYVCVALLLMLWQNLHPSVLVAAIVAFGTFLARVYWTRGSRDVPWRDLIVAGIAGLFFFATPAGATVLSAATNNANISRALEISEWLPAWHPKNRYSAAPGVGALLLTAVMALRRGRHVDAADVGRAVALAVATMFAYRFAVFWAMAMVPVWASLIRSDTARSTHRSGHLAVIVGVGAVAMAMFLPSMLGRRLFSEQLPLEGVDRLRDRQIRGVVYCHPRWGGPLIGLGNSDWRVSLDGRYYVYSVDEWIEYVGVVDGEFTLAAIVARHRPIAFFLHHESEGNLIDQLERSDRWKRIFADERCVVYVPRP